MDYNNYLNPTLVSIKPSGIRKFFSIAEEMDDVISLGVGEPDFKTPWHIRQTGINSLEHGATRYTANAGLILLRNEIANFQRAKKMAVASGTQAFQNFTGRTNNNYMEKVLAQWSMM